MSISRKITGDASGGSGGSGKYVDDVFSTYLYEGTGANRDIVNGIELGSRPPGMTQSLEWPVGARFAVSANGGSIASDIWTIDYWCKFKAEPTTTMVIYDTRTNDTNSASWRLVGGELKLLQGDKPDFDTGYYPWVDSPNEWSHHAITLSDGVVSFFVNGTRVATQSVSGRYRNNASQIGESVYQGSGLGGCLLSNFRINSLKGYATSLTFPVPEGPSRLQEGTSNLLFTENDVAPGTSCPRSSVGTDPILYDKARGVNQGGQESQGQDIVPIASADSPYSNSGYEGKGGLVWVKGRDQAFTHILCDTERGPNNKLESQNTAGEAFKASISAFNSDGFSLAAASLETNSAGPPAPCNYVSWTFAKQEGFFDVVTYTGQDGHTQPHNLGTVPGMVIVKCTSDTQQPGWIVWHRDTGDTGYLVLNDTAVLNTSSASPRIYNVTDTSFDLGDWAPVSNVGKEYVAYVFAHDAPMFGPEGDESIIKCGGYTGSGTATQDIDLGWEPQWLLIKSTTYPGQWGMFDSMRGLSGSADFLTGLYAQSSAAESNTVDPAYQELGITPTGFHLTGNNRNNTNGAGQEYIYMAIRRPMKPAEEFEATDLFNVDSVSGAVVRDVGLVPDMALFTNAETANSKWISARLQGAKLLRTNTNGEEASGPVGWDNPTDSWSQGLDTATINYFWRRAPGFFDVVCYEGDGQATHEIPHNLGTYPEMAWIKSRDETYPWPVYCKYTHPTATNQNYRLDLSTDGNRNGGSSYFPFATSPDSFPVGSANYVNATGASYIAYLFASVPGVCDIGTYIGYGPNGNVVDVDCGFTNGARFVLVKRTDGAGNWMYWDALRGSGDVLALNDTSTSKPARIYHIPQGFRAKCRDTDGEVWNPGTDGAEYIYIAIA